MRGSEPICGVCREHVDPGEDHVTVEVETMRSRDRNEVEDYVLHIRCADSVLAGWGRPA